MNTFMKNITNDILNLNNINTTSLGYIGWVSSLSSAIYEKHILSNSESHKFYPDYEATDFSSWSDTYAHISLDYKFSELGGLINFNSFLDKYDSFILKDEIDFLYELNNIIYFDSEKFKLYKENINIKNAIVLIKNWLIIIANSKILPIFLSHELSGTLDYVLKRNNNNYCISYNMHKPNFKHLYRFENFKLIEDNSYITLTTTEQLINSQEFPIHLINNIKQCCNKYYLEYKWGNRSYRWLCNNESEYYVENINSKLLILKKGTNAESKLHNISNYLALYKLKNIADLSNANFWEFCALSDLNHGTTPDSGVRRTIKFKLKIIYSIRNFFNLDLPNDFKLNDIHLNPTKNKYVVYKDFYLEDVLKFNLWTETELKEFKAIRCGTSTERRIRCKIKCVNNGEIYPSFSAFKSAFAINTYRHGNPNYYKYDSEEISSYALPMQIRWQDLDYRTKEAKLLLDLKESNEALKYEVIFN